MRKYGLILLTVWLGVSLAFAQAPPSSAPTRPRLVLVISIDQMRYDYLERFEPLYKHGLRRILDAAAVFTNANYRHASTETGPGHSVLLTGTHPMHSGIVANDWWDPYLNKVVNVVDDPLQNTLGGSGRAASPKNLLTFTVGDVLKSRSPRSRVVGIGLKDRSAILLAGHRANAAYWFENAGGNFVTSTYYMEAAPNWLTEWNKKRTADRFAARGWNRLIDDVALYEKYAGKDAVEGERDRKDITFPHPFTAKPPSEDYYVQLRRSPFADEVVLEFAMEALKQHGLGKDADTDILTIGFAATDGIGHGWGPDSQEQMDQFLRLDGVLGRLFEQVDSAVGLANTLVVLSADHGSRPLVEIEQAKGIAARRVAPKVLQSAVQSALDKRYPGVKGLMSYFAIDAYLNREVVRQNKLDWKEVEKTAVDAMMATGLVEHVYTQDDLRSTAPNSDPNFQFFRNAFYEPRSPHLTVQLKPDVYMNAAAGGTSHGSVYEYDRHIPVVFMGKMIRPGRYAEASGPEDIAPTLASILGLEFPHEYDSRLLLEMLPAAQTSNAPSAAPGKGATSDHQH
jgi:predicted AlkP superfamily pyrophosphatase or phosphodiesterase